jgi:hypothetical protein
MLKKIGIDSFRTLDVFSKQSPAHLISSDSLNFTQSAAVNGSQNKVPHEVSIKQFLSSDKDTASSKLMNEELDLVNA